MVDRRVPLLGIGFIVIGVMLLVIAIAFGAPDAPGLQVFPAGVGPGSMMGSEASRVGSAPSPGSPGFVAGTLAAPRRVRVVGSGQLRFVPDVVTVKDGETITFEVTTDGMSVHEFMVGPAADVAADTTGTPEIADIAMMQSKSLTYTFTGTGPFAFACHAPGHYEAGMSGTIVIVP